MPTPATTSPETPSSSDMGPPLGDFSEAYSAIDEIGSTPNPDPQPNRETPSQEKKDQSTTAKPASKDKPPEKTDAPKKKSLGEDIDGILKPDPKEEKATHETSQKPEDTDKLFDSPSTPKQLREAHKRQRDELAKASQRVKELEESVEKVSEERTRKVREEYETRLGESERRRSEMETELRFLDYQRSEDYKTRFLTPISQAWDEVKASVEGMQITDPETGNEREVQPQDIASLLNMSNPNARKAAEAMFGSAAPEIMSYRAKLMGLKTARDRALEEWKTKGSEREAQIAETRKARIKTWESAIESSRSDYPELFGDRETDPAGNDLLRQSLRLTRTAFIGEGVPDGLTPEQRHDAILEAQTKVAVRAMAYPRTLRDLKAAEKRVAMLEAKLKEYEGSELPHGDRRSDGGVTPKTDTENPEDAIDAIPGVRY